MSEQSISDPDALSLLKAAMAAHDAEFKYWPKASVEYARAWWQKSQGNIPSLDAVANHIGNERALRLSEEVFERRTFENALKGYKSPCHYCGSTENLVYFDFALMRVTKTSISLGGTLASAAMSAVTFPLLGAGALRLPGKSLQGAALHLKIVVCKPCCKTHGNMLGLFMMNEKRASKHPLWNTLQNAGFTKFLDKEKMPQEFHMDIGQHL